jgi:hypothetical protein
MKKLLKAGVAVACLAGMVGSGCAYGAMAISSDGTVFVARNDSFLMGALRKIFACKPNGAEMTCQEVKGAP